jgi:hypothetical protein
MKMSGVACVAALLLGAPLSAQQWNGPRVLDLVRLATSRRAQQLADTGLRDYHASAHGYVTFLAQLGEGFHEPPQIVKADELALEVYWRAPNLSKQLIQGRRDTTLLPTDIQYHRDHLGIVQNNFPATIRLGEGDEVRDVPHPLSTRGLADYDFELSDSLRISYPGRVIDVYEVKVRPKNDREAGIIGALYLERETGQVVRMAFSFTRAAYLDKQLEDVFIVLENGLVGARFWLPLHQEVEIRRTATWLDYPVRGIIRGRWEIGDYQLNTGLPGISFSGPEIDVARVNLRDYPWPSARIVDSLPPDVRVVAADEIRRVQAEARSLVREQALRRGRSSALAAAQLSDFVRFNRVEGTALGAGLSTRIGGGFGATARARYGTASREGYGRLFAEWNAPHGHVLRAFGERDLRDVSDVAERSLLVNSLASQEFASDYTDTYRVESVGAEVAGASWGLPWTLSVARERHVAASIHAIPASGRFAAPLPADSLRAWRTSLSVDRPSALWIAGVEMRAHGTVSALFADSMTACATALCGRTTVARAGAELELAGPVHAARVVARTIAAATHASGQMPAQSLVYFGGPMTGPGYQFHTLVADRAVSQRLEMQTPLPFPSVSLGRFGRSPSRITLAPYVGAVAIHAPDSSAVGTSVLGPARDRLFSRPSGVYASAGLGLLFFFDVLRVDVARGLRGGRWMFSLDANRSFWGVL